MKNDTSNLDKTLDTIDFHMISLVLIIFGSILFSIIIFNVDLDSLYSSSSVSYTFNSSNSPKCEDLTFEDTAICLNNYVRKIFIYNVTEDNRSLSLDELIERGGDCNDWVSFYETYFIYYGFPNIQKIKINVDFDYTEDGKEIVNKHIFLIVSDYSGYCHIDMADLTCFQYLNENGESK